MNRLGRGSQGYTVLSVTFFCDHLPLPSPPPAKPTHKLFWKIPSDWKSQPVDVCWFTCYEEAACLLHGFLSGFLHEVKWCPEEKRHLKGRASCATG